MTGQSGSRLTPALPTFTFFATQTTLHPRLQVARPALIGPPPPACVQDQAWDQSSPLQHTACDTKEQPSLAHTSTRQSIRGIKRKCILEFHGSSNGVRTTFRVSSLTFIGAHRYHSTVVSTAAIKKRVFSEYS